MSTGNTGNIEIVCGENGSGKTALALGRALQALTRQNDAIVIQFLKGRQKAEDLETIKRLEPELKIFCFEKASVCFEQLNDEEKQEERINILNGLNYAKKVLTTGECGLLVLDEVLGLLDQGIVGEEELCNVLNCRGESDVILTGQKLPEHPEQLADRIGRIVHVEVDKR